MFVKVEPSSQMFFVVADLKVESISDLPDSMDPFIATQGKKNMNIKIGLKNIKTGTGNGDSIRPAEGNRVNFDFTGFYSSDGTNPLAGYSVTFDMSAEDHRRGIPTNTVIEVNGKVSNSFHFGISLLK
jgi:hypothetical protein